MDMMKIGKFIAELRRENKITQEELGEKLGVTNKTISCFLRFRFIYK
jgi:transcriptional regulator with XRE-family HTH domain